MYAEPYYRADERAPYSVTTSLDTTKTVDLRSARGARILIPDGSGITSLTPHETWDPGQIYATGGEFDATRWYQCGDADAVMTVAAGNSFAAPDSLFALGLVRFVADVAGEIRVTTKG